VPDDAGAALAGVVRANSGAAVAAKATRTRTASFMVILVIDGGGAVGLLRGRSTTTAVRSTQRLLCL
jgi:hypothetical protein